MDRRSGSSIKESKHATPKPHMDNRIRVNGFGEERGTTGAGFIFKDWTGVRRIMFAYDSQITTEDSTGRQIAPPKFAEKCYLIQQQPHIWYMSAGFRIDGLRMYEFLKKKADDSYTSGLGRISPRDATEFIVDEMRRVKYRNDAIVFGWDETLGPQLYAIKEGKKYETFREHQQCAIGGDEIALYFLNKNLQSNMTTGVAASIACEAVCEVARYDNGTGGDVTVISVGKEGMLDHGKHDIQRLLESTFRK